MKIVYPTANTQIHRGGVPITIAIGQHWRADDGVVKDYPSLFSADPRYGLNGTEPVPQDEPVEPEVKPEPVRTQPAVEQTTANPGEQRAGTSRR